jgi:hypothetical protein
MMTEPEDLFDHVVNGSGGGGVEELHQQKLSDIKAKPMEWVWQPRYARGFLTGLFGDGGTCKSTFDIMVMARLTTGEPMPFEPVGRPPGTCVVLSLEDDAAYTLKPRFVAAGGDPDRLIIISSIWNPETKKRIRQVELERDLERLREALGDSKAIHLTVSPVSAYLGDKRNSWKDSDVRQIIDPLQDMAASLNITGTLIFHPNKNAQQQARYRMSGSQAFFNACRMVLVTAPDPEQPERLVLVGLKGNPPARPLGFSKVIDTHLVDGELIEAVTLDFPPDQDLDARKYTADYVLATPATGEDASALDRAVQFLTDRLGTAAERVLAKEIEKDAEAHLIAKRTLERARVVLKVRPEKGPNGWALWIEPKDHPTNKARREL